MVPIYKNGIKTGANELNLQKHVFITQGTESYSQDNYDDKEDSNIYIYFQQDLTGFKIFDRNEDLLKQFSGYPKEMFQRYTHFTMQ